jgi:hypothetical protein
MANLAFAVSRLCGGQPDAWQSILDCHGGLLRLADGRAHYVARAAGLSPAQARRFAALIDWCARRMLSRSSRAPSSEAHTT